MDRYGSQGLFSCVLARRSRRGKAVTDGQIGVRYATVVNGLAVMDCQVLHRMVTERQSFGRLVKVRLGKSRQSWKVVMRNGEQRSGTAVMVEMVTASKVRER